MNTCANRIPDNCDSYTCGAPAVRADRCAACLPEAIEDARRRVAETEARAASARARLRELEPPVTDYAKRPTEIEAWVARNEDTASIEDAGFGDLTEEIAIGVEAVRDLLAQHRAASEALAAAGFPADGRPLAERIRATVDVDHPHPAAPRRGIYFASKTKHAAQWISLRNAGVRVVSTWIDEAGVGQTSDWQDLWDRCLREASTAAALVMYVEPDETHKGSLAEVGAALHAGVPVFWVGPEVGSVRRARGVTICETLEEALGRAATIERLRNLPTARWCRCPRSESLRWNDPKNRPECTACNAEVPLDDWDEPTCPGPDCPMCNGEACALCGAGTRDRSGEPDCGFHVAGGDVANPAPADRCDWCGTRRDEHARPPLTMIIAIARNGVIGKAGGLPWRIPEDLRHFKRETMGHALIVGRKTAETLPPLDGRRVMVVSRTMTSGVPDTYRTLETAVSDARWTDPHPVVIGGAEVYRATLPYVTRILLTEINADHEGDTFFHLDRTGFVETERRAGDTPGVSFVTLERAPSARP